MNHQRLQGSKPIMKPAIIVSMTTTANRAPFLQQTLNSILAQTVQPNSLELNIPHTYKRHDLEPVDIKTIPAGFSIFRCEDYGPATKLLPTLQRYAEQDVIIIYCDDDRVYKSDWIERLVKIHDNNDGCCVADEMFDIPYFVNQITIKKSYFYRLKRALSLGFWNPRKINYSRAVIAEGFGGVLVKPEFFDELIFKIPNEFFFHDDIWFSAKLAERKIPIKFSDRKYTDKSIEVIIDNVDIGREKGSLTTAIIDGQTRTDISLNTIRFAIERLGVWQKYSKYLQYFS